MKKRYIQPNFKLLDLSAEEMLAALSGGLSDDPYSGVAGAKADDFFGSSDDDVDPQRFNLWED